jgi:hypothetical protein
MPRTNTKSLPDFIERVNNTFAELPKYKLLTTNITEIGCKIEYICACGKRDSKLIGNVNKNCASCKKLERKIEKLEKRNETLFDEDQPSKKFWLENLDEFEDKEKEETWRLYPNSDIYASDKGRFVNIRGKLVAVNKHKVNLVLNEKRTGLSVFKIIAELFKVEDGEKLKSPDYVGTLIDDEKGYVSSNIKVVTKAFIINENHSKLMNVENPYISDKELPLHLQNLKKKVLEDLPDYWIFEDGTVFNRKATIGGHKVLSGGVRKNNERITVRIFCNKGEERKEKNFYVDVLVCMAFHPIEGKKSYDDYKDMEITYSNNDCQDLRESNLEFTKKVKVTEELIQKRQENKLNRIEQVRERVTEALKFKKATLITEIEKINKVTDTFSYKCHCGTIFNRSLTDIRSTDCRHCVDVLLKDNTPSDKVVKQEINGVEYDFVRCTCGWVCAEGIFLNNFFDKMAITKQYVTLGKVDRNARHELAKAFKLPGYELLETGKMQVELKDKSKGICKDNLEIISKTDAGKRLIALDKTPSNLDISIEGLEGITLEEFKGITIYSNGIIKTKKGVLTKGKPNSNGYLEFVYNGLTFKMHRLICFAFNPLPNKTKLYEYGHLEVDHINFNKSDNNSTNLRWVTGAENVQHGVEHNIYKSNKAVKIYKLLEDKTKGDFVKEFPTQKACAEELEITAARLSKILKGVLPQTKYFVEYRK